MQIVRVHFLTHNVHVQLYIATEVLLPWHRLITEGPCQPLADADNVEDLSICQPRQEHRGPLRSFTRHLWSLCSECVPL